MGTRLGQLFLKGGLEIKKLILFLFLMFYRPLFTFAQEPLKSPFIAVFVDDAAEKELGSFPYDRSKYAEVIAVLRKSKAKAVVLKYFLDQEKSDAGDEKLSGEIKKMPVLLQARLDPKEPHPNPLPVSFGLGSRVSGDTHALLSGQSGWVPLEKFSQDCAGVGFVDIASKNDILNIPMVLKYQDTLVPSLELAALQLAFDKPAQIFLGNKVTLAGHQLPVDPSGQIRVKLPVRDEIDSISFLDVIQENFDRKRVAGKIVILGFDAKETPVLATPLGPLRIHRLFYHSLESLYEQFEAH